MSIRARLAAPFAPRRSSKGACGRTGTPCEWTCGSSTPSPAAWSGRESSACAIRPVHRRRRGRLPRLRRAHRTSLPDAARRRSRHRRSGGLQVVPEGAFSTFTRNMGSRDRARAGNCAVTSPTRSRATLAFARAYAGLADAYTQLVWFVPGDVRPFSRVPRRPRSGRRTQQPHRRSARSLVGRLSARMAVHCGRRGDWAGHPSGADVSVDSPRALDLPDGDGTAEAGLAEMRKAEELIRSTRRSSPTAGMR